MYINNSYKNINVSGIYTVISDNTSLDINKNCLSSIVLNKNNNLVLYLNSKVYLHNNNLSNVSSYIKLYDNTKLYIDDYDQSKYKILSYNNSLVNFPNISNGQSFLYNTHGILPVDNKQNFYLTVLNLNNLYEKINLSNLIRWGKQLSNDGQIYKFIGNSVNDIVYPYKIISFNIIYDNNLTQDNLNKYISYIPKDLHQAKLCILLSGGNIVNTYLSCILSGYYNGKILIYTKDKLYSNTNFIFDDCLSVYIHNLYLSANYYSSERYPILINNVLSVIISASYINNIITDERYKTFINLKSNFVYRQSILSSISLLIYYNPIIKISTANLILKDNFFNSEIFNTTNNIKNLLYIIAIKNSLIVSDNNMFYMKPDTTINKRPIIFYSAYNSKITAINDKLSFDKNTNIHLSNNALVNEVIWKSVSYGYALPGAIFNHNHKLHILTQNNITNMEASDKRPQASLDRISIIKKIPDVSLLRKKMLS